MMKKIMATICVCAAVCAAQAAELSPGSGELAKNYPILSKYNAGRAPSNRILKRGDHNVYAILHFGPNTFTDREWGYGDEDPKAFNPSEFDAEQIVKACKDGGITGIIIVCKHHDGLCMWPSKTTEHNITKTGFRDGKGDFVKEMADACRKYGLDAGFYVSPWDRNNANYGKPEYLSIFREQLREVLSNYGPAFEVFLDGANGGDGYYGGARERRTIDHRTYYDWLNTWQIIRDLQPDAAIFSDVGPDVRWIGNEQGLAAKESFGSFTPRSPRPAEGEAMPGFCKTEEATAGHADGVFFIPGDCDVPLRPGWFYHEREDNAQKSVRQLVNIYLRSVGEGAYMNLGMAPDKRGLIHENDVKRLKEFKAAVDSLFAEKVFEKEMFLENNEGVAAFGETRTLNFIKMQEDLAESAGEQVMEYYVEVLQKGKWKRVLDGKAIGLNRLRGFQPVECSAVHIVITKSHAPVRKLKMWGYLAPDDLIGNGAPMRRDDLRSRKDYVRLTAGKPNGHAVEADLPAGTAKIQGVVFTPLASVPSGTPDRCILEVRKNGVWSKAAEVEFSNIRANPIPQMITVQDAEGDRIRLTAEHTLDDGDGIVFAEIGVISR